MYFRPFLMFMTDKMSNIWSNYLHKPQIDGVYIYRIKQNLLVALKSDKDEYFSPIASLTILIWKTQCHGCGHHVYI
jgi:Ni,Fe-hydrogenase I cytochrome b subunit